MPTYFVKFAQPDARTRGQTLTRPPGQTRRPLIARKSVGAVHVCDDLWRAARIEHLGRGLGLADRSLHIELLDEIRLQTRAASMNVR